jgi:group I intron endonuclease
MINNPINEIYIGQTINLKRRINNYKNYNKLIHQRQLKESFIKFGYEKHNIKILMVCNHDELNFWEEFYIKLFDSFEGKHGLNRTSGGKSHKRMKGILKNDEWKLKISQSHRGKKRKPFSEEWRKNISISHIGIERTERWIENLKIAAKKEKIIMDI